MGEQRKLWKIGQIDGIGIRGPHEKELQEFSNTKYPLFKELAIDQLKDFVVMISEEKWTTSVSVKIGQLHLKYSLK